jgi:undecaprenyl-diphosphatase
MAGKSRKFLKLLARVDRALCVRISGWNGKKAVDKPMIWLSRFGSGHLYPFVALAVTAFDTQIMRPFFSAFLASVVVEHSTYKLVKTKTRRLRPFEVIPQIKKLISFPDQFSFPSGHAAGAFLMATLFGHFYPGAGTACYSLAALVGFSRVYNGIHYPSDVLAGSALGVLSARLGLMIAI